MMSKAKWFAARDGGTMCLCVSVTQHLTFHAIIPASNDTNLSGG